MELDEIDLKILRALIRDARTNLKDIAKECGLSSNAIFKRIQHLRSTGVIMGTILFVNMSALGNTYPAAIGVNLNPRQEKVVAKLIRERANVIDISQSVGEYDLCVFMIAKSISEIDYMKQLIRKQPGVERVAVSLWSKAQFIFENLNLQPQEDE